MIILVVIAAVAIISILVLIPKPILPSNIATEVRRGTATSALVTPQTLCWDTTPNTPVLVQHVTVIVYSGDDTPINGATVHLEGAGVDITGTTTAGKFMTNVDLATANQNPGSTVVDVTATFGGVTVTSQIPVSTPGSQGCPA